MVWWLIAAIDHKLGHKIEDMEGGGNLGYNRVSHFWLQVPEYLMEKRYVLWKVLVISRVSWGAGLNQFLMDL